MTYYIVDLYSQYAHSEEMHGSFIDPELPEHTITIEDRQFNDRAEAIAYGRENVGKDVPCRAYDGGSQCGRLRRVRWATVAKNGVSCDTRIAEFRAD